MSIGMVPGFGAPPVGTGLEDAVDGMPGINSPMYGFGFEGGPVADLQKQLNAVGAGGNGPIEEDGYFGRETEHAVATFQGSKGLPATGVVDAMTLTALEEAASAAANAPAAAQQGTGGPCPMDLQGQLLGDTMQARNAGAEDAAAVMGLLGEKNPQKLAGDLMSRFQGLIGNVQAGDTAPPKDPIDVARFQGFVTTLEQSGKLGDLRKLLDSADASKIDPDLMPDSAALYMGVLVGETGTPGQAAAWGPIE